MGKTHFSKTILLCVICVFVALAILCHLVALCTHYWLRSDSDTQSDFLNIGLWVACFDDYIHPHERPSKLYDGCHDLYSDYYTNIRDWLVPGWLVACRVLAIIALVMEVIGLILLVLLLLWIICKWLVCSTEDDWCERCVYYAAPILFILSGMLLVTVVMMFADNAFKLQCKQFWVGQPNENHLSYSWGFEVAAAILALISGGMLMCLAMVKGREEI